MDKSLSTMSVLFVLLFSFLLHSVANCQLTFDRVNKNGAGQGWPLKRMTHPYWSDQVNSFWKHSSGQPLVKQSEDLLSQKSLEVSHRLLSELGIRDSVKEYMIQQVLLACYKAEEEDNQVKIGHKYEDHQGFQVTSQIDPKKRKEETSQLKWNGRKPFTCEEIEKMIQIQLVK